MREVITIQTGSFANYVGAHYWNIQDEALGHAETDEGRAYGTYLDADVLFRLSQRQGRPLYTPRVVFLDLSGSLGGNSASGGPPPSIPPVTDTWHGRHEVHRSQRIPRSGFVEQLDLETDAPLEDHGPAAAGPSALESAAISLQSPGGVRYWTDYLKVVLHPKSVYQVPGVWHGAAGLDGFYSGADLLRGEAAREEVLDRIRFFAEDCDSLQGFQLLADDLGGWGGATAELLQGLRDEYAGSPVLLWAARRRAACTASPHTPEGSMAVRRWQLSEALSAARLAPLASAYSPVAPPASRSQAPHLALPLADEFSAAGAIAVALDCATLPWRLPMPPPIGHLGQPTGATDLQALAQLLQGGRPAGLAALRVALPAPGLLPDPQEAASQQDPRFQRPQHSGQPPAQPALSQAAAPWTPGIRPGSDGTVAESIVLRGARRNGKTSTVNEAAAALDASLMAEGVQCVQQRCVVPLPLPLPLPFPRLVDPAVGRYGDILDAGSAGVTANGAAKSSAAEAVVFVSELTRLVATQQFRGLLLQQRRQLASAAGSAAGRAVLGAWGLGRDDVAEASEQLQELAASYGDDGDSSSEDTDS